MIQGAITGLILALIALFGAYLFRVVPGEKHKTVSFALIALGMLLMLTNIPYSFGMIEQNNALDVVFLILLFGGGLLAFIGLSLKVNNREANDYPKPEPTPPPAVHKPVGSFTIAILAVVLALMKLALFMTNEPKQKQVNFRPPEPRAAVTKVESIDEATGLLFDGYPNEKELAWKFLSVHRDDAPDRASEIGKILANRANDGFAEELQVRALDAWFCPDMAKSLVARLESGQLSGLKKELHELFGNNRSMTAAEYLSNHMHETGSIKALRRIGPPATKFVIHQLHCKGRYPREQARELLREWAVEPERLIQASIEDLRTKNGQNIEAVAPYLNGLVNRANEDQLIELAELTEQIIVDPEIDINRSTIELIQNCAREPETPAAVLSGFKLRSGLVEKKLDTKVRREMERFLRRFPTPEIEDVMLDAWLDGRGGTEYMSKNKSPTLAKKVAGLWGTLDGSQLEKIRLLQFKVPDAIPLVFDFCFEDLKSEDPEKVGKSIDWLEIYGTKNKMYQLRRKVFKPYKSSVEAAIREKLNRIDDFDPSLAERIKSVAKSWGVEESDQKAQ